VAIAIHVRVRIGGCVAEEVEGVLPAVSGEDGVEDEDTDDDAVTDELVGGRVAEASFSRSRAARRPWETAVRASTESGKRAYTVMRETMPTPDQIRRLSRNTPEAAWGDQENWRVFCSTGVQ
jgi:hypothetical protein